LDCKNSQNTSPGGQPAVTPVGPTSRPDAGSKKRKKKKKKKKKKIPEIRMFIS
jgi:hypothetical protein